MSWSTCPFCLRASAGRPTVALQENQQLKSMLTDTKRRMDCLERSAKRAATNSRVLGGAAFSSASPAPGAAFSSAAHTPAPDPSMYPSVRRGAGRRWWEGDGGCGMPRRLCPVWAGSPLLAPLAAHPHLADQIHDPSLSLPSSPTHAGSFRAGAAPAVRDLTDACKGGARGGSANRVASQGGACSGGAGAGTG